MRPGSVTSLPVSTASTQDCCAFQLVPMCIVVEVSPKWSMWLPLCIFHIWCMTYIFNTISKIRINTSMSSIESWHVTFCTWTVRLTAQIVTYAAWTVTYAAQTVTCCLGRYTHHPDGYTLYPDGCILPNKSIQTLHLIAS